MGKYLPVGKPFKVSELFQSLAQSASTETLFNPLDKIVLSKVMHTHDEHIRKLVRSLYSDS